MIHPLGKALAVTTLLLVSAIVFIRPAEKKDSLQSMVDSTVLGKSGIKDLDVEYVDGNIYLNVELSAPRACPELVDYLKIRPITIKSKIYQPTCTKISDMLMRITYTRLEPA